MQKVIYFENYKVGDIRKTHRRTITESDIIFHAGHTGDFFPHHVDAIFCQSTPFKERIAHGTMTFSIGIGLTATLLNPVAFTYGYERLRFPKPVFIGDTIYTEVEITNKEDDPKRAEYGRVCETCRVKNQNEEVVLYCEHILLAQKKQ